MITTNDIYKAGSDVNHLSQILYNLVVEKMKLDKFFSTMLDSTPLDESADSADWIVYKEMIKEYDRVELLINIAKYQINKYDKRTNV